MSQNETDLDQPEQPAAVVSGRPAADAEQPNPYLKLMAENRLQQPPADPTGTAAGGEAGSARPAPTFGRPPSDQTSSGHSASGQFSSQAATQERAPSDQPTPLRMQDRPYTQLTAGVPAARSRRRGQVIIAVVIVAVALLATVAVVLIDRVRSPAPAAGADVAAVVRDYLTAIADADAERAVALLADPPGDTAFLSAAVLRASREAAPITDITVADPGEDRPDEVAVSYRLGERQVRGSLSVRTVNDNLLVDGGYDTLDVGSLPTELPLTVNGTKINSDSISLFPGSYRLDTPVSGVGLGDGTRFAVTGSGDAPVIAVRPALTKKGRTEFRQSVTDAVRGCLASTGLQAGCGLTVDGELSGGRKVRSGSVQRSLTPEAEASLADLTGVLDPSDPRRVRPIALSGLVRISATCTVPVQQGERNGKTKKATKTRTETCRPSGDGTVLGSPVLELTDGNSKDSGEIHWE